VYLNAGARDQTFVLPVEPDTELQLLLDTTQPDGRARREVSRELVVPARSVLALRVRPIRASARNGSDRDELRALATQLGIVDGYHAYDGSYPLTNDDTRVALLAAMGIDTSTSSAIAAARAELHEQRTAAGIDAVRVLPQHADALRFLVLRTGIRGHVDYHVEVAREDGSSFALEGRAITQGATTLTLPAVMSSLPVGYHRITCSLRGAIDCDTSQDLIVTPRAASSIDASLAGGRAFGITAHLYALRREPDFGVGDFRDLHDLVTYAAVGGADFVGHNPLHATDPFTREVSPYYPSSRLFENPIYLDLEAVPELVASEPARQALAAHGAATAPRIDYASTWRAKLHILRMLHERFVVLHATADTGRGRAYRAFVARHDTALEDFATFCALEERHGSRAAFPSDVQHAAAPGVARFRAEAEREIALHRYLQFELDRQLGDCQRAARSAGMRIGLYGDLAVGNAPGGACVWSRPELFARGVQLGAPPDAFTAEGQTWGLLPLVASRLRADRYRYFIALCRQALRHAGMLRVDHVMGLLRQFWVPDGASAKQGAYVRFPFEDLAGVLALESVRAGAILVGEDLGIVPEGLRERMAQLGMLRSHVLYFERDAHGGFGAPQHYSRMALATVNTHDLPPLAGFAGRRDLAEAIARSGLAVREADDDALRIAVHRYLAAASSVLVAASFDDLCGEQEALNVPGSSPADRPNWSRRARLTIAQLTRDATAQRILEALRVRTER
ncbi:MAG TPA: 4-alpha-glucanotransferase, partial [Polyangiales bacterium]|nr:4-alpha-glucanotransferase [Polyangiales bacterium]